MPTPCKVGCGNNAILKRPKTGDALCKECFFWAFETEIHHTIVKGKLFKSGDSVAIAASGGKDSTVLAHVLKLLNEKYSYGLNLMLLSIDEGITGYRDDSLDTVKQNKEDYEMNLKVLSYEELYGWTMDSIVREVGKKNNCTFCGVFRRQALDRGAAMLGVNVVATGHNADDIAETVIMNVLRGDVARLQRCTDAITASEGEGTIPRVKPLKYAYEKEIVMYAYFKQLVYFSTECIYSPNAYRGYARALLKDLEKIRPTAILDIIHSGEELRLKSTVNLNERTTCSQCGFVSSQEICKACVLLEGLNRGLPKLGIGKSSKANKMRESLLIKRKKLHNMPIDYSKVRSQPLSVPPLEDVKNAISKGLKKNFSEVSVEVVDCPDLRAAPFNLASKGLGGKPTIVEVGGPPYLLPSVDREKVYDIKELVKRLPINPCFVIGAGAGPWPYLGKNAEMVANVCFDNDKVINKTYIAKVKDDGTSNITVSNLPENETRFALLANFFFCEGTPSKVLKIHCKNRTGTENFISAIRVSLEEEFKNDVIGLGGTFLLKEGKAKQHVMPDFSQTPLNSEADLNKWLNFYEMSAPLVACGTLVSKDIPGLDLRVQHFHSFSDHGEAGHYHEDTTPRQAEYLGYFTLGTSIHRFDQPVHTHAWGRD